MRSQFLFVSLLLIGCGSPPDAFFDGGVDAGTWVDAGNRADAGPLDGGVTDAGQQPSGLPILGNGKHDLNSVDYLPVAGPADGLSQPRDVAINPASPTDVWIVDSADNSMVIVKGFGTAQQTKLKKSGTGSVHFMPKPAALAFGAPNRLATAHEQDQITQPTTPLDFMGPTLWPSDSSFEGGWASHLDMLHNSPDAVGIAWDSANIYWVFDGYHNALTRYDFGADHGPGGNDHSDGNIARCAQGQVSYLKGVSSGLEMDQSSKLLYVADSGNRRIAVLDTKVMPAGTTLSPNYDGATQRLIPGMTLSTLVSDLTSPLRRPSGLALRQGIVYVSDNETSRILAFDLTGKLVDWLDLSLIVPTGGLMGIDFDAQGNLFFVDTADSRVLRISARP